MDKKERKMIDRLSDVIHQGSCSIDDDIVHSDDFDALVADLTTRERVIRKVIDVIEKMPTVAEDVCGKSFQAGTVYREAMIVKEISKLLDTRNDFWSDGYV